MNRWIMRILMFDFTLKHISAMSHQGPDGLSRRRKADEEDDDEEETTEEVEDWVDEVLGCGIWVSNRIEEGRIGLQKEEGGGRALMLSASSKTDDKPSIPTDKKTERRNNNLHDIKGFLDTLSIPPTVPNSLRTQFIKCASEFFISGNRLWRKDLNRHHQLVLFTPNHLRTLKATHDELGHKGVYSTRHTIANCFWWPSLNNDVAWYIKTCHQCQLHSVKKIIIPPTVATPTPLFHKAYVDSVHMPTAQGYGYTIQARCSLTGWPEWRKLKNETGRTIRSFLFKEILCRWGGLEEIVMDNGTLFIATLNWLADKYHIRHIRISPYNSKANGIVERSH